MASDLPVEQMRDTPCGGATVLNLLGGLLIYVKAKTRGRSLRAAPRNEPVAASTQFNAKRTG